MNLYIFNWRKVKSTQVSVQNGKKNHPITHLFIPCKVMEKRRKYNNSSRKKETAIKLLTILDEMNVKSLI